MSGRSRDEELALRKQRLLQRIEQEREALGAVCQRALVPPLRVADKVGAGARWLMAHPVVPAAVAAGLIAWRPVGLLRWAGRGLWLWRTWRKAQPIIQSLTQNNKR